MRRFWVDESDIQGERVTFSGDAFHHLVNVSRFGEGDEVEVLFGAEHALKVKLTKVSKKSAEGAVTGKRSLPVIRAPFMKLVLGLPRPATFDAVLEKAVELGCKSIQPVISEHSFTGARSDRWQKIVKAATEQTGRADLLEVLPVQKLADILKDFNPSAQIRGLFLYEGDGALDMRSALQTTVSQKPQEVWVFIGSEGGFSAAEVQLFQEHKLQPITMGAQILRTETACVASLSVLKYELGLMR